MTYSAAAQVWPGGPKMGTAVSPQPRKKGPVFLKQSKDAPKAEGE